MANVTEAIILSSIKYSETSVIMKCYSGDYGVLSFIIKGIRSRKRTKFSLSSIEPLSIVEIEFNKLKKGELSHLKNIKTVIIYDDLRFNIIKSNIALFLSEFLSNILRFEEENIRMYVYVKDSLIHLDKISKYENFHINFLINLLEFLGIKPEINNENHKFFDIENGIFKNIHDSNYCVGGELVNEFKKLLGINFDQYYEILKTTNQRRNMTKFLMNYFEFHISGFKRPNSLEILNGLFS